MGTHRQRLLYDLAAFVTLLACEMGVHSNHLMTSSCSLIGENIEKRAPGGVHDGLGEMMVLDHVGDSQVLNGNVPVALGIGLGRLEMMVPPLPVDFQMRLGCILGSLGSAFASLLASAQLALLAPECCSARAIEARVLDGMTLRVG